ncbi:replication initiator protein A, partial [Cryptosporangium minutisporangium]
LPKVFMTNPKYIRMSSNAKLAWAILRDRSDLSLENGWVEEETGRIYFLYSNENLMRILQIGSKTTISNVRKELINAGLLENKKQGQGKTDRLYILRPDVTKEDVYKIKKMEDGSDDEKAAATDQKETDKEQEITAQTVGAVEKSRKCTARSPESVPLEVQKVYRNDTELRETDFNETEYKSIHQEEVLKSNILPDDLKDFLLLEIQDQNRIDRLNITLSDIEKNYLIHKSDSDVTLSVYKEALDYSLRLKSIKSFNAVMRENVKLYKKVAKQEAAASGNEKGNSKEVIPEWFKERKESPQESGESMSPEQKR